jgi:hypothetical protein
MPTWAALPASQGSQLRVVASPLKIFQKIFQNFFGCSWHRVLPLKKNNKKHR